MFQKFSESGVLKPGEQELSRSLKNVTPLISDCDARCS